MATAVVGIAPVLTPHTLGVLADTLERDRLSDKAILLRRLRPFVEGVVDRCFVALVTSGEKGTFVSRFNRLSRDFEPFRVYLNSRLVDTLGNQELLSLYQRTLLETLEPFMQTAREMEMNPEVISAALHDYMSIFHALIQLAGGVMPQPGDPTVEQFAIFVEWVRAASRFDYGLTAVFLVLEMSIPTPGSTEKIALLSTCQDALLAFGRATSELFVHDHVHRALRDLETPRVRIAVKGKRHYVARSRQLHEAPRQSIPRRSRRQTEIEWLARNKELANQYGGQWIVVEKDELVANDPDYRKARETATQRGIKRPFIIFVPLKEIGGFIGI